MNSSETNVLVSDLERALLEHPDITAAAVTGLSSEQLRENPIAFVEIGGPVNFNSEDALNWVNAGLRKHERIYELHVVAHLPRSSNGDVLKEQLQIQLNAPQSPLR